MAARPDYVGALGACVGRSRRADLPAWAASHEQCRYYPDDPAKLGDTTPRGLPREYAIPVLIKALSEQPGHSARCR